MRLRSSHLVAALSAVVLLASCGGGAKSESDSSTGAIAFSLTWPGSANISSKPSTEEYQAAQAVNCAAAGIDTIYAEVWDGNKGTFLNVSATFFCSFGQGTLSGVPAGTNRLVRMFGKDLGGTILYRGTQSGISVTAGVETAAGSISMSSLSSELSSIAITPASPSIAVAGTQQMTATGTYTDASTSDITSSVSWDSTETGVASITGGGLITGVGAGDSVITATSGTVFTSTVVTVTTGSVTLDSIDVTPTSKTLASISATQQLTATANYDDSSTPDVTSSATWSSTNDAIASVSSSGLVTAIGNGAATITATLGAVTSNSVIITVSASVTLSSIAVTPDPKTIDEGATQAYTATGTYSDSSTLDLTSSATWTSSVGDVATIDGSTGIATGTGMGTIPDPGDPLLTILTNETTITATIGSVTNTAALSVKPLPLPPENVSATAGNNLNTVSWDSATGATSYNLYWDTSSGVTTDGGTEITGVTSPYSHTSLTGGTTYYYIVTAVSDGSVLSDTVYYSTGEGDASSEVSDTPTAAGAPSLTGTTPTNDTTPTWSWTSGGSGLCNGSTVYKYKLDDSDLSTGATLTFDCNYTYADTPFSDASTHTLYVQESVSGSWSPTGSLALTIDTTAPDAPTVSGTTPTNDDTPTWTWSTGGGNESYRYKFNDSDLSTGATTTASTSYTAPAQSDGTYTLYVQESDAAGNWSSSDSVAITIDTTAPGASGTPTDAGSYTSSTTVTFSWTAATDAESGIGSYTLQVNTASNFGGTDRYNATVGNVLTYDVSGSDGDVLYARVYAVNGAGTTGSASGTSDGILIDATAPTTPGTPTDAGTYSSSTTVAFTWTAASDSESAVTSYNLQVNTQSDFLGTDRYNATVGNVLTYSPTTGVDGDTLYARVQAVNGAGTTGSWTSASDGITVDTSAPSAPTNMSDGASGLTTVVVTTITFTWTAGADAGSGIASYTLQVNTQSDFLGTYRYNATVGNVTTYDVSGTDGDTLYARVYAVNGAGTTGSASGTSDGVTIDVSLDVTAPQVDTPTSPASGATGVLGNATIAVTFDESMDTSTITGSTFTVSGGVTGTIGFSNADKTATLTPSSNMAAGSYTVTITTGVTDVATNALASTYNWSFTVSASSNWDEMLWDVDVWGP